jgi:predicted O-methyltransferase YrrM
MLDRPAFHPEIERIEPRQRMEEIGLHYQESLYLLVRSYKPQVVVETGTRTGVATKYILAGLVANGAGVLASCDPLYKSADYAVDKLRRTVELTDDEIDRFKFYPGESKDTLQQIALDWSPWGMFVHDSDHSAVNMLMEIHFAWDHLSGGGVLVVDDYQGDTWQGHKPHEAFTSFCKWKKIEWQKIGRKETAITFKP